MFDQSKLNDIAQARDKWEETTLHNSIGKLPERADEFITACRSHRRPWSIDRRSSDQIDQQQSGQHAR